MKYQNLYKIPEICNNSFGLKISAKSKFPTKILYSPNIGLFWYYRDDIPPILDDDYDFSNLIEYVDFVVATYQTVEDPDVVNWNLISYSFEDLQNFFKVDELPAISLYGASNGTRVLFANGEWGTVIDIQVGIRTRVKLDNIKKCPTPDPAGIVYQNLTDGKHTGCEYTKPEWSIISWTPSE